MAIYPLPQVLPEKEASLVEQARIGNQAAFGDLVEPWRRPLFGYVYRMVTHRQDAEDLTQDTLKRALESLPKFKGTGSFKSWLFGIATHVCLDYLRRKKRWRVKAQLLGEQDADSDPQELEQIGKLMAQSDYVFEIREHITFCFSCIARTLVPELQAALMLREMLGFTNQEAADILNLSEPTFRHRLSAARKQMTDAYEGLCQLINKTGVCHQCAGLREFAPEKNRGKDLVQIRVKPDVVVTPDSLFNARLEIVRASDLEDGRTHSLHTLFFEGLTQQEESSS